MSAWSCREEVSGWMCPICGAYAGVYTHRPGWEDWLEAFVEAHENERHGVSTRQQW